MTTATSLSRIYITLSATMVEFRGYPFQYHDIDAALKAVFEMDKQTVYAEICQLAWVLPFEAAIFFDAPTPSLALAMAAKIDIKMSARCIDPYLLSYCEGRKVLHAFIDQYNTY